MPKEDLIKLYLHERSRGRISALSLGELLAASTMLRKVKLG